MTPFLLLAALVGADMSPLAVDAPAVNFGELTSAKPLVHTFRLQNQSNTPVTINEITGSCGCFRQQLSERTIAPGKSAELTIGINLLTQPEGSNTWKLLVRYRTESSAAQTGERLLQITAKIRKDVTVEPVALMLLAETEITGSLTVTDRRGKPLTVTATRLGLKNVRTEIRPAAGAAGRRTQKIDVTVADACAAGQYSDELCLDTDDPEYRELRIPVRVVKKAAHIGVQAVPARVNLRFAKEQSQASYLVRLRSADDKDVIVDKAESDHPAVSCKWAAGPGTMTTLRVSVDLDTARAPGIAVVTVHSKGPKPETVLIPVSWTLP